MLLTESPRPAARTIGSHLVRLAFCKRLEVIDEAVSRLQQLAPIQS